MPGQTFRLAALSRDHIYVKVAGILAAKGNPFSVRREVRIRGLSLETRDAARHPARARHHPNILRIGKSDLRSAHRRRAQQTRAAVGLSRSEAAGKENRAEDEGAAAKLRRKQARGHEFSSREPNRVCSALPQKYFFLVREAD